MIKVRFNGALMSCEILQILFPTDPKVDRDDEGFFFTSPALEDAEQTGPPWAVEAAELMLSHMNGIARIRSTGFRGLVIAGYEGMPARARISGISATAWDRDGDHGLEPVTAAREMSLATSDFRVARALRLLGYAGGTTNWFDLYKIYETMRADLKSSGHAKLLDDWIDKTDLRTFTESANRAEISGDGARHAELEGLPSGRSMTLREGRDLMTTCVRRWLAWKVTPSA